MNSACGWAKAIAGKTHFAFLGCVLDTEALSTNWLKPLDNEIYIVKGVKGLFTIHNKCLEPFEDKNWKEFDCSQKVGAVFKALQHSTKTISDNAAALRCFATFGLVILTPYKKGFGITKNVFAVVAGGFEIVCRVNDLWILVNKPVKTEEEQRVNNAEWLQHMLVITTQVFAIQLNFFGGLDAMFRDSMNPEDRMPDVVFNFWGTIASFTTLGYGAVGYFSSAD